MFIKLSKPYFLNPRTYPAGSVVEVDENTARELVKYGIGVPDDGPAFEPKPSEVKKPGEDQTRTAVDPRIPTAHHAVKKG